MRTGSSHLRSRATRWFLSLAAMLLASTWSAVALDPGKLVTQYGHASWGSEQGLPQGAVHALIQSTDGYIWLATSGGLVRFDGIRFATFDQRNSNLTDNDIESIAEDTQHRLWVAGPQCGLNEFRDGRFVQSTSPRLSPQTNIRALAADRDGGLWVGTIGKGLLHVTAGAERVYRHTDGLPSDNVSTLFVDREGKLWVGTWEAGLARLDGSVFTRYGKGTLPSNLVWSIQQDATGAVWVASFGGLVRLSNGRTTARYGRRQGLPSDNVTGVFPDRDRNIWISTSGGGLSRIAGDRVSTYTIDTGLSDNTVLAFLEDREGDLWTGTATGVDRFRDDSVTMLTKVEGLAENAVRTVFRDHHGAIWVGTFANGLDRIQNGNITHFGTEQGLPECSVLAIGEDAAGALWAGCGGGTVARLNGGRFERMRISTDATFHEVSSLRLDANGRFFVGTLGRGILRLEPGRLTPFINDPLVRNTLDMADDGNGGLWIASADNGLFHADRDGRLERISNPNRRGEFPRSLFVDRAGTIWLGLNRGGLAWLRNGQVRRPQGDLGLLNGTIILGFGEDRNGDLWASTSQGVFRLPAPLLTRLIRRVAATAQPRVFSQMDGLRSVDFGGIAAPVVACAQDGAMWFATSKGVAIIRPDAVRANQVPPPVVIEEVDADGRRSSANAPLTISPGVRRLTIRYAGLSFKAPEGVRYRYRLVGYDPAWIDAASSREISYTSLRPRRYRFLVMAANSDGVWNPMPAGVDIELRPLFYQTLWFATLCLLAVLPVPAVLYQLRMRAERRRIELAMEERLDERTRIAQEIHDTLLQNLISVGWQLQAVANQTPELPERAWTKLQALMKQVDGSVREVRLAIFNMRSATAGIPLPEAIEKNSRALLANTDLSFTLEVMGSPFRLPSAVELETLRISQEAIHNAIRHAGAHRLGIVLAYGTDQFTLSVQDDGLGFDPSSVAHDGSHFGLSGMRERAARVGGTLQVHSTLGQGTTVVMSVKLPS